ncbi:MAG: WYL domain-containing protein [Cyclobacteriaceae bacterium]|jgi:predicted DNA-binding transcriptional regulator YafY|nr:WYL domain-containing protein [Cytophagales bacterium]MCZ8327804.1 WYL domain-containing protein [Cyclobacteriaceae bacterium]
MPSTRKPQERAEILDELLAHGKWTGKELLARVNEKLQDLDEEIIDIRTLRRDLDYLETKRAPLHRPVAGDMSYYYTEKFSLKNIPLDSDELRALKQAISILRKVENFQLMDELDLIIGKLANRIHTNVPENQTIVQFENHTSAKGTDKFNDLFDAIRDQTAIDIIYHSYRHPAPKKYIVHPYLLKEYRNRWWLLGREGKSSRILTLGLDRIQKIKVSKEEYLINDLFNPDTFFDKVIGVSIDYNREPQEIILKVNPVSVQHVESKPIHKAQEEVNREKDGSLIIKLKLMINYELKATILGFGEGIEVLEPVSLRDEIKLIHEKSYLQYK